MSSFASLRGTLKSLQVRFVSELADLSPNLGLLFL